MKKLLIGAFVTAGVIAAVLYIKRMHNKYEYIEEDENCDHYDYDTADDDNNVYEDVDENTDDIIEADKDIYQVSSYYDGEIAKMTELLDIADKQIKDENFAFAMMSIRLGMETGVKCIIFHGLGSIHYNGFGNEIKICQEKGLLSDNFINDLQEARRKCNNTAHSIEENSGYDDALFCYRILEELINKVHEFA